MSTAQPAASRFEDYSFLIQWGLAADMLEWTWRENKTVSKADILLDAGEAVRERYQAV